MALIYDPNLVSAANGTSLTPYAIDREWCLGDSLFFINRNFNNLDTRTTTLESRFPIANANVSNTAAIAGTKISPNFGSAQVLTTGNITGGSISTGGNITGGSISTGGNLTGGSISTGGNISASGTISATGQIYSGNSFSTAGNIFASGTIGSNGNIAVTNKTIVGGGGLGGGNAGYIVFNVPGYGLSRYWGGWSWWDNYAGRIGVATNGDLYAGGTCLFGAVITNGYYPAAPGGNINLNSNTVVSGNFYATGFMSSGGGKAFKIDHPKKANHTLSHFCIEGPSLDLLYRGTAKLINGKVDIDIDSSCGMTQGTVSAIAKNLIVASLQNQTSFSRVKPTPVVNGKFSIVCEEQSSNDEVFWIVIGVRCDIPTPLVEELKTSTTPSSPPPPPSSI